MSLRWASGPNAARSQNTVRSAVRPLLPTIASLSIFASLAVVGADPLGATTPNTHAATGATGPDRAVVLDTACLVYLSVDDNGIADPLEGGETRSVQIAGDLPTVPFHPVTSCIPADSSAVMITLTVIEAYQEGNLRLVPTGAQINGGVVNYAANGLLNGNTVTVPLGPDGKLELSANSGPGDSALVAMEVIGYYSPTGDLAYQPVTPCAVIDTRPSQGATDPVGPFLGAQDFPIDVKGSLPGSGGAADCGVPDDADAALINVVAVNPLGTGRIFINFGGGTASFAPIGMNNAATTVVPTDDDTFNLRIASGNGPTHFRVVVLGYFERQDGGSPPTGSDFVAVSPCVGFDSRPNRGPSGDFAGPRDGGQVTTYTLTGPISPAQGGGGNDCGVPVGATGVLVNLVALNATTEGNLRISAAGETPTGGVLNFAALDPAMNNSNAVPVGLSNDGRIDIAVNTGPVNTTSAVNVRAVILGYYIDAIEPPLVG